MALFRSLLGKSHVILAESVGSKHGHSIYTPLDAQLLGNCTRNQPESNVPVFIIFPSNERGVRSRMGLVRQQRTRGRRVSSRNFTVEKLSVVSLTE
jgi:hypothetical protein